MKKLLKFLSFTLILLSIVTCAERKDWTCSCSEVQQVVGPTTFVITDVTEKEAIKECDANDVGLLGVIVVECSLVE